MRIYSIPADEGYTFPCSRKAVKATFGEDGLSWISFGAISRHFTFDSRAEKRPRLTGTVVAALTYPPSDEAYLCLYPVGKKAYDNTSKSDFVKVVLPCLYQWLKTKRLQSAVSGSSHKQILAEWTGKEHHFHELQFLFASH